MSKREPRDQADRREGIAKTAENIRQDAVRAGKRDMGHEAAEKFVKQQVTRAEAQERK